ncbi:MAG: 3-dehydroquinate synthase [Crocinitomicaceae bacterium]|jgi:3-dehydroquinate synthase|nr:3-dehydroquinate synthase [Crocinitomicaceae bacterium]
MKSVLHFGSFGDTAFAKQLSLAIEGKKVMVLLDENSHRECLSALFQLVDGLSEAEIVELPSGEQNKTLEMCEAVWSTLTECQFSRKDVLIALGGGVICDMGGFIAALYKRGMDCIYVPTTLLAMVDASVGGKTGVDFGPFKNHLGVFNEPSHIFFDDHFLLTLPEKEIVNGLAEMIKHYLLIGDREKLVQMRSADFIINLEQIEQSVAIKKNVVEQDPNEKGLRKTLNLGHTVAHGLEGFLLDKEPMDHGLAVAHGLLVEAKIAENGGLLKPDDFQFIEDVLSANFEWQKLKKEDLEDIYNLMLNDKKNDSAVPSMVLLTALGQPILDQKVSKDMFTQAMVDVNFV